MRVRCLVQIHVMNFDGPHSGKNSQEIVSFTAGISSYVLLWAECVHVQQSL
jgi:hypothetical protein